MVRAIDTFVNVDWGNTGKPEWLVRVAEDYFKNADEIFKPVTMPDLIEAMDRAGVFRSELVEQNLQKERTETGTESTLHVIYQPRGSVPTTATSNNNLAAASTAQVKYPETR